MRPNDCMLIEHGTDGSLRLASQTLPIGHCRQNAKITNHSGVRTSAIAQTLERNVFLDARKRFERVIRRPAHKTGRHRAGRTLHTLPVPPAGGRWSLTKGKLMPLKEWVGGQSSSRRELRRHARLAYVVACIHALHDRRYCAARERNVFLDARKRFERVIRRPPTKLGGTGQGALCTPARRPRPSTPCRLS